MTKWEKFEAMPVIVVVVWVLAAAIVCATPVSAALDEDTLKAMTEASCKVAEGYGIMTAGAEMVYESNVNLAAVVCAAGPELREACPPSLSLVNASRKAVELATGLQQRADEACHKLRVASMAGKDRL